MTDYAILCRQLTALLDTRDWLTNAAQTCAFVMDRIEGLNWVGFYVQRRPQTLVLGPFQGKPACTPIAFGDGVCGAAAATGVTQRVEDVLAHDNHIVCDPISRSELVVPIRVGDDIWGLLDLDSPHPGRFSAADQSGVEQLADVFARASSLYLQFETPASVTM